MATSIVNLSPSTEYVATSALRSVRASTTETDIEAYLSKGGVKFFSAELYAYEGFVELYDPGDIIETYFRANDIVAADVTVGMGSASLTLHVVYCAHDMPPSHTFAMLLSTSCRRVRPGSVFSFNAIPYTTPTTFTFRGAGVDSKGNTVTSSYTSADTQTGKSQYEFEVNQVLSALRMASGNKMTRVAAFTVSARGMKLTCYVADAPPALLFRFRNIYNVFEYLDVVGDIVTKDESTFSQALAAGNIVPYDRKTDRTYQVTTEPLPDVEFEAFRQLCESHEPQICVDGQYYGIVVTDHTIEDSTAADARNSYKFTWRFAARRPRDFRHAAFGLVASDSKIFSQEYSDEYD